MRLKLSVALTVICLALPLVGHADLWKELKKAERKTEKLINPHRGSNRNNSSSQSTNNTTTNNTTRYNRISGIEMKLNTVERWGDGVLVVFSVTNSTGAEVRIGFSHLFSDDCIHRDEFGNESRSTFSLTGSGGSIPAGVTKKFEYMLYGLNPSAKTLVDINIDGRCDYTVGNRGYEMFTYAWKNIPISSPNNTNNENVTCTLPTLYVSYEGAVRDGNNVVLTFTLKNTSNQEIQNVYTEFDYDVYGEDGSEYKGKIYRGNATVESWFKQLPPDVPMRFHFDILNVPQSEHKLTLVRLFFRDKEYKIDFRDVEF